MRDFSDFYEALDSVDHPFIIKFFEFFSLLCNVTWSP